MASDSPVILRRWHAKATKKALLGAYLLSAGLLQLSLTCRAVRPKSLGLRLLAMLCQV